MLSLCQSLSDSAISHFQAFVFFPDWTACGSFVQDHISQPVSIKGKELGVHFVMQHMSLELSEVRTHLL